MENRAWEKRAWALKIETHYVFVLFVPVASLIGVFNWPFSAPSMSIAFNDLINSKCFTMHDRFPAFSKSLIEQNN